MAHSKRVFILGAGFSKPAGMPLSTELLSLLSPKLDHDEMRGWLAYLSERLKWLSGDDRTAVHFALNIEQVFHHAHFDIEVHRLSQQLVSVGRNDGSGTPWSQAESISTWLGFLEESLCDVIVECEDKAELEVIKRWGESVNPCDSILTFNYDTLVERALKELGKAWNHGIGGRDDSLTSVFKLHGSIDWVVAHRSDTFRDCDLLFDKANTNRAIGHTGHVEDDFRLWRSRTRDWLRSWLSDRDLQLVSAKGAPANVGIAGLGTYKQLHQIPGLGHVWKQGMESLYEADVAVVVGFSMSDFDLMAQMQFGDIARTRHGEGSPLRVIVIDPYLNDEIESRFRRVFRSAEFIKKPHERVDWTLF